MADEKVDGGASQIAFPTHTSPAPPIKSTAEVGGEEREGEGEGDNKVLRSKAMAALERMVAFRLAKKGKAGQEEEEAKAKEEREATEEGGEVKEEGKVKEKGKVKEEEMKKGQRKK